MQCGGRLAVCCSVLQRVAGFFIVLHRVASSDRIFHLFIANLEKQIEGTRVQREVVERGTGEGGVRREGGRGRDDGEVREWRERGR